MLVILKFKEESRVFEDSLKIEKNYLYIKTDALKACKIK